MDPQKQINKQKPNKMKGLRVQKPDRNKQTGSANINPDHV